MRRLKTGIAGLDTMLNGGLPEGRAAMISGHCGTGKTLLGFHFIHQGQRDHQPAVLITFEQAKEKVMADALEIGVDLAAMEKAGTLRVVGGSYANLRYFKDKARAKNEDLINEIKEIIGEIGAKRVVVDSVNLYTMLFDTDGDRRMALASLIYTFEQIGCTSMFACEVPEDSKRHGWFGFEEFMVDSVISLDRAVFDGNNERTINVVKMRGSAHSSGLRAMEIKEKGIVVYADQEPQSVKLSHFEFRR